MLGRPISLEAQKVWNFGLTRFNLTEWRRRNMTAVYQVTDEALHHPPPTPPFAH